MLRLSLGPIVGWPSVRMGITWAASDHCYYVLPCDRQKNPLHSLAAVSNAARWEEYPRWQAGPGITSGWLTCPCQLGRAAGFQVDSCYLLTGQTKQPIALLKLCLLPDNFSYFHRDKSDTSKHNNANTLWFLTDCHRVTAYFKQFKQIHFLPSNEKFSFSNGRLCLVPVVLFVRTNGMGKQRLKCLTTMFRTFQACFVNRVTSTDKAETLPDSIASRCILSASGLTCN